MRRTVSMPVVQPQHRWRQREEQAINALCAEVKRVRAEKAAKGFDETAIDKYVKDEVCKKDNHAFVSGDPPLSHVSIALLDPLHGFNNECQYLSALYDDYATELQDEVVTRNVISYTAAFRHA